MIYPGWVCQLIAKTVCSQLRHEYAGTCRSVDCLLGEIGRCRVGGRVSAMCCNIFCESMTGRTCGDSVPEVGASMYSMVCVETIWM